MMVPPWEYALPLEQLGTTALVWCVLLTALGYAREHMRERRPCEGGPSSAVGAGGSGAAWPGGRASVTGPVSLARLCGRW